MHIHKIIVATALFAATSLMADVQIGAKIAGSYNMFWNVDDEISENDLITSFGGGEEYDDSYSSYKSDNGLKGFESAGGMGVSFGLTLKVPFSENIAFAPELLLAYRTRSADIKETYTKYYRNSSEEPWKVDSFEESMALEFSISQWFIDLPVMFRFTTGSGVYLGAGPVFSLNLDSEGEALSAITLDVDDYTSTIVIGIAADLGYSLKLPNGHNLDLGLRYQMGLTSLVSDDISIPDTSVSIDGTKVADPKDFNFSLGIGYWFM